MLLFSDSLDPLLHLAVEKTLYRIRRGKEHFLYLYKNSPCIICGRNQNLLAECNPIFCQENGIVLCRRITGGGTVYQDDGNLNYAFIVSREEFAPDLFIGLIQKALQYLGISQARIDDHHSIYCDDCKVSGSAFALNRDTALLHGCILVNADLPRLHAALHSPFQIESAAVLSRPAKVQNLAEFHPGLTTTALADAILKQSRQFLAASFPGASTDSPPAPENALISRALPVFKEALALLSSPSWIWDRSPDCTVTTTSGRLHIPRGSLASFLPRLGICSTVFESCLNP